MNKIKVSVIGTGHLGRIHAKLWGENPLAELVGIYDLNPQRAKLIAEELNCAVFTDLSQAINASDAVTIAAPTVAHFEIAMECIAKQKHCLIEKPITATYKEAEELIKAAKNNSALIQVGHVERFNPGIAALKDYTINPRFIEAHRLSQFRPRATDVSVIHDLMIHDIDIVLWLVKSEIKNIDANGVNVLTETTDIANARINFENGCTANITASRISANPMRKMRIFQPNAYISIDFAKPSVEVYRIEQEGAEAPLKSVPATMLGSIEEGTLKKNIYFEQPTIITINAIAEEQTAFANAIMLGSPIAVEAVEAAKALYVAEEISNMITKV